MNWGGKASVPLKGATEFPGVSGGLVPSCYQGVARVQAAC